MDSYFATVNEFGKLSILKTYVFYDEPLIFVCQNQNSNKYLLLRLADEQAKWLATEVSNPYLEAIEKGKIELRKPFMEPEKGSTYLIDSVKEPYSASRIPVESITEDMLPYPGEYLMNNGETLDDAEAGFVSEGQIFTMVKEKLKWESHLALQRQKYCSETASFQSGNSNSTGTSFIPGTEGDDAA